MPSEADLLPEPFFAEREDAGKQLAVPLARYRRDRPIVLGLPRGGVIVAAEIARALKAPLRSVVACRVCVPSHPELGIAAIGPDGALMVDRICVRLLEITDEALGAAARAAREEWTAYSTLYGTDFSAPEIRGRTVILVDDGVASGHTARATIQALREQQPHRLIFAAPVGAPWTVGALRSAADDVVCLHSPEGFRRVSLYYENFEGVPSDCVLGLLARGDGAPPDVPFVRRSRSIGVPVDNGLLTGELGGELARARGLVVFAHGAGSSRLSPRNRYVAKRLRELGFATLLVDLLTPEETGQDRWEPSLRFDIGLLTSRLVEVLRWIRSSRRWRRLPLGIAGSSTGAAAALQAAAEVGGEVRALVSRAGRVDLTPTIAAHSPPTLLIVGGDDDEVLALNRQTLGRLGREAHLEVVPGAGHLFEEPHVLDAVAMLTAKWLDRFLLF